MLVFRRNKCPKCKNNKTKWRMVDGVDVGVGIMPISEEEVCTKCGFQKTYIVEDTYYTKNWKDLTNPNVFKRAWMKLKNKFKKKKDDELPF